ncbi:MAG: LysR family transcriptional regulator [Proteobacteria bacterium]|nr:LysR family transcriptional regulator [Pseudomonadota bacterium]MBU1584497.1 LysR family transcriptional regulator [Pseudomonadota bacterium]MBU2454909.1 LysR family transcriptional regulator [Pseudomonadota bacterium]MBU2630998.1 LysR family transcriptional regulator [Pseudomonadota bacterium]
MLPDFNRLKVFYAVFTQKSVAAAAKELNITPSAVSQALNKLEVELNVLLFTRLHKKLVPTSAGGQLYNILVPFIRDLEIGIKQIKQAKQIPSGMIRIGSPIEFGKSYFPGIFASFRKKYSEVVFTMKLGDPSEIFPMIKSGELDFGMVDIFLTRDQVFEDFNIYSIEPLINEEVVLACSKIYYDEEIKGDHSFENLASKEFISYQRSSLTLRNWFKYHFNKFPVALNRVLTVDSHQAVINGIKNQLGMGVIAGHIVSSDIKSGNIIPIKTAKKNVINKISLVQLQDKVPNLTEKTFINYLKTDILSSGRSKQFLNIS